MDIASPSLESCQARKEKRHEDDSDSMYSGSGEFIPVQVEFFCTVQLRISPEDATNACDLQRYETVQVDVINTSKSTCREKRTSSNLVSGKYALRSSLEGARGRQSETVGACETAHTCIDRVHVSKERRNNRHRGKETKKVLRDEFFSLRKRFRYLLTRMSYEQSLIDAYSGEGWKGQSLEKIRPKKELQRATSEILRCKLEVRELVKHLDALCAEGKLQASSFDSQGQGHINCEDIFCAKCGLKDSSANNDIILCDGICERGFHQMCLVPPLLNEQIPPGDEIWLCPGCRCKVYCIDLVNDVQGTQLSILDKWEKVFPETAGDKQCIGFGESDDSEDSDYDPDGREHKEEVLKECSSYEEADCSASDDSNDSVKDEQHEGPGFTSDDSEDNNFDPSGLDIDKMVQHEGSSSNEFDFTSNSDDLSALGDVNVPAGSDKDHLSSSAGFSEPVTISCKERLNTVIIEKESSVDSEQLSMKEQDLTGKVVLPVSRKRHQERLDYKKLYNEAYGNIPSDSSEDEDWAEMNTPKKVKNDDSGNNNIMSSDGNTKTVQSTQNFKVPKRVHQKIGISPKQNKDQVGGTGNTSSRIICQKLESEDTTHSGAKPLEDSPKPDSVGNKGTTSSSRCFGKVISQKLYESLKFNVYPTRETKESLSKELGITVRQISKWFENARRSLRLSADREGNKVEKGTTNNDPVLAEANGLDPESRMEVGREKYNRLFEATVSLQQDVTLELDLKQEKDG